MAQGTRNFGKQVATTPAEAALLQLLDNAAQIAHACVTFDPSVLNARWIFLSSLELAMFLLRKSFITYNIQESSYEQSGML